VSPEVVRNKLGELVAIEPVRRPASATELSTASFPAADWHLSSTSAVG
jgi:hypothetical protein